MSDNLKLTAEDDQRLASAVSSYGVGTRSYNRSPEKRELDRQRAEVTQRYMEGPRPEFIVQRCNCRSFNLPHELSRHKELRSEMDWRTEAERNSVRYQGWEK